MKQNSPPGTPETINIHLTRSCNFACRFCYAGFRECASNRLSTSALKQIITLISGAAPLPDCRHRKINFAGGEPLLAPDLIDLVGFSRAQGLKTSIVTNGSLLTIPAINRLSSCLDILALSVDSGLIETNLALGRSSRTFHPDADFYLTLAQRVRRTGIRLKINTVVSRPNLHEELGALIVRLAPFRWKVFQVKKVVGQNDADFDDLSITLPEFETFVAHNRQLTTEGTTLVPESADDMTASYAMIAPNGCFFDSVHGHYRYSRPILKVGLEEAFRDVTFSPEKFMNRGGRYE